MANKKKDKPRIINNIQELNIEIDYDKLADAIVKAQNIANMQNANAAAAQLADCCCKTQSNIKDVQYQMATDTCAVNTNVANVARDIIDKV